MTQETTDEQAAHVRLRPIRPAVKDVRTEADLGPLPWWSSGWGLALLFVAAAAVAVIAAWIAQGAGR